MKIKKSIVRGCMSLVTAGALVIGATGIASASENGNTPISRAEVANTCNKAGFVIPEDYSIEDLDAELTLLSSLSDEEQDRVIAEGLGLKPKQEKVAPLVIVAAIGCAVGAGGALFNTNWSSASSVAWSLAGALVSCIPGASQAKLVSVILKHKAVIAKALKAVGAVAAANALLTGDSARP